MTVAGTNSSPTSRAWAASTAATASARALALRIHHRGVGLRHALPALVAVHGVVAADHRGDAHAGQVRHVVQQRPQLLRRGARRGVAAVGQGVDGHRNARRGKDARQRRRVALVAVHAARRGEAEQVAGAAGGAQLGDEAGQHRRRRERAVRHRRVDPRQVLHHHPPGADVEVPDLGVAHLPFRQADIVAGGAQEGARPGRPQRVEGRACGPGGRRCPPPPRASPSHRG